MKSSSIIKTGTLPDCTMKLDVTGKPLEITLTFSESESAEFDIILRATPDISEQTELATILKPNSALSTAQRQDMLDLSPRLLVYTAHPLPQPMRWESLGD